MNETETQDLKELLTDFWIKMMEEGPDPTDKIKCSELLAKFILGEGSAKVKRRGLLRPSTTEVLQLARQIEESEQANGDEYD